MASPVIKTIDKVHITRMPGVCGGRPCVAGTRIRVQDIYVWYELQGRSPDEIVHDFPQLTLGDVYAALSYFWDNREAMLAHMEADRRFVEEMRTKHPSLLKEKLTAMRQDGTSIPS